MSRAPPLFRNGTGGKAYESRSMQSFASSAFTSLDEKVAENTPLKRDEMAELKGAVSAETGRIQAWRVLWMTALVLAACVASGSSYFMLKAAEMNIYKNAVGVCSH